MGPWAFGVPLVLVSALGLLLNAYVLLVVLGLGKQTQQQQTANTLLLIHLGAVEAAVCLVLLVFATGSWPVAGTWCVIHGFLLALLHPVALWTITGLNCDRYYAISAPLHYTALVSPRRVALGLAISWAGALLLCLPPFSGLVPPYSYVPDLGCCAPDFGNAGFGTVGSFYALAYAVLGLVLPALLVTICNVRVLGIARYHRHRIASAIYEVTLSAQVTITHQRNPFFVPAVTAPAAGGPPKFHSAFSTVMQFIGSLYVLYFPYCGVILWEACSGGGGSSGVGGNRASSSILDSSDFGVSNILASGVGRGDAGVGGIGSSMMNQAEEPARLHVHSRLASLASLLLACSPPINGLLYGLKSRTLRRSVQNYWRKKVTKSELQQEIQARTPSAAGSRRPSGSGPASSFFPFPPLQRRLSEALLALGNCRSGAAGAVGFGSGNIAGVFQRARLQPAASCNTLRVPNAELGESGRLVRSSASAVSLMAAHYRSDFVVGALEPTGKSNGATLGGASPKRSPRILITRAYSEESQDGASPLLRRHFAAPVSIPPCEKRRWRHRSTESDSSTGSSDASVWTTGVQAAKPPRAGNHLKSSGADAGWPGGRRFTRVKTLEEGAAVFSAVPAALFQRPSNNSESSDTATDNTTTTTTTTTASTTLVSARPLEELQLQQRRRASAEDRLCAVKDGEPTGSPSDEDEEQRRGTPDGEEDPTADSGGAGVVRATTTGSSESSSSWSCADDTAHSALDNSRGSTDDGLVMRPIGETIETEGDDGAAALDARRPRRKSRIVREAEVEAASDREQAASQLRPLLTSSSS